MSGMYRTHAFTGKNSKDFLTVGDPYAKKIDVMPRYKKKQFQTNPPKRGQSDGYFNKMTYATDNYQTGKPYLQIEPLKDRKMGFGSRDARRRDEFSSDVRTRQWREKLSSEHCYTEVPPELLEAAMKQYPSLDPVEQKKAKEAAYRAAYEDKPNLFQTQVSFNTYDIGRTTKNSTPICNKCPRDTFYCKHRLMQSQPYTLRRPGTAPTTYTNYGSWDDSMPQADRPPTVGERYQVQKPKYGHVHSTNQFFDESHLRCSSIRGGLGF